MSPFWWIANDDAKRLEASFTEVVERVARCTIGRSE